MLYQCWAEIDLESGRVEISCVETGTYGLTVYANAIFGQYTKDNATVAAGGVSTVHVRWSEEGAGTEIWRMGIPEKSSGEYKHGYERDRTHPLHHRQYRISWAVYDFPTDFLDGFIFKVEESTEAADLNYVHWSVFGGYQFAAHGKRQQLDHPVQSLQSQISNKEHATFTVQLAGAKAAVGNTDVYSKLSYTVAVKGMGRIIPYYHSSSAAARSVVIAYNVDHKIVFDTK